MCVCVCACACVCVCVCVCVLSVCLCALQMNFARVFLTDLLPCVGRVIFVDADCLVLGKHQHILVSKSITQKARKKKEEEKEKRHKHAKIKEKQEQKARMNTCMHIYPAYISRKLILY